MYTLCIYCNLLCVFWYAEQCTYLLFEDLLNHRHWLRNFAFKAKVRSQSVQRTPATPCIHRRSRRLPKAALPVALSEVESRLTGASWWPRSHHVRAGWGRPPSLLQESSTFSSSLRGPMVPTTARPPHRIMGGPGGTAEVGGAGGRGKKD